MDDSRRPANPISAEGSDVLRERKLHNYVTGSGAASGLGVDAYSGGGPGRE
jgi:hypothetical protein